MSVQIVMCGLLVYKWGLDSNSFHTPSVKICTNQWQTQWDTLLSLLGANFNLDFTVESKNTRSHKNLEIWTMSAHLERNQRKISMKTLRLTRVSFCRHEGSQQEVCFCHADITRISTLLIIWTCPQRWRPIILPFIQLAVWCFVSDKKLSESMR